MKERITCKKVLLNWLKEREGTIIAHHLIDSTLYEYGEEMFGVYYSPATYHRVFCWIKDDPELLKDVGLKLEQLVEGSGKVNSWKVNQVIPFEMILE